MKPIPLEKSDISMLADLQPEGWSDIRQVFQFYLHAAFCFPIVIRVKGKPVGIGSVALLGQTAWLAHIIVHQEFRNQGIGLSITKYLTELAMDKGARSSCLLATRLGLPVYKKVGFQAVGEYTFMMRDQYDKVIETVPTQAYTPSIREQLLRLDREVSGEDRTLLFEPYLQHARVIMKDNILQGFYLPGLGEGTIVARNSEAGINLMRAKYADRILTTAVLPAENQAGLAFLKTHGFRDAPKTGTRMVYGEKLNWKPKAIFSRISGNFG